MRRLTGLAAAAVAALVLTSCSGESGASGDDGEQALSVVAEFETTPNWSLSLPVTVTDWDVSADGTRLAYVAGPGGDEEASEDAADGQGFTVGLVDLDTGKELWKEPAVVPALVDATGGSAVRVVGESVALVQHGSISGLGANDWGFSVTTLDSSGAVVGDPVQQETGADTEVDVLSHNGMVVRTQETLDGGDVGTETNMYVVGEDGSVEDAQAGEYSGTCEGARCTIPLNVIEFAGDKPVHGYDQQELPDAGCDPDGVGYGSVAVPFCVSGFAVDEWRSAENPPSGFLETPSRLVGATEDVLVGAWQVTEDDIAPSGLAVLDVATRNVRATLPDCPFDAATAVQVATSPDSGFVVAGAAGFGLLDGQSGTARCFYDPDETTGGQVNLVSVTDSGVAYGAKGPVGELDREALTQEGGAVRVDLTANDSVETATGYVPIATAADGAGVFLATDVDGGGSMLASHSPNE